jgi:uncharacterized membrane protein YeaQ/YmgE (transglycosylase-associated protein family)
VGIILWIILGGVAGWLAHVITGKGGGLISNIIVGIIGAFIGGLVMNLLGGAGVTGFNLYSLLVAVVGAIVLLFLLSLIRA